MSDLKPRGRPKTDAPLSTAERTRRLIGKADAALHPDTLLGPMPDSVLLLALTKAYRAKSASAFARIAGELASRLGLSVATTDIPSLPIPVEPTEIQPSVIPVVTTDIPTDPIPVETTDIQPSVIPVETTKPISERDAAILALAKIGTKKRAIGRQLGIPESTVRWVIEQHTTH